MKDIIIDKIISLLIKIGGMCEDLDFFELLNDLIILFFLTFPIVLFLLIAFLK